MMEGITGNSSKNMLHFQKNPKCCNLYILCLTPAICETAFKSTSGFQPHLEGEQNCQR